MTNINTLYETIGGQPAVDKIVDSLYKHIGANETLLPIFPEDLEESARKQRLFLTQFFGGPPIYSEELGRPMLPVRHQRFEITPARRDAWLGCMQQALTEAGIEGALFKDIMSRLAVPAFRMVNTEEAEAKEDE